MFDKLAGGFLVSVLLGHAGGALAQGLPGGASSLNEMHGDWLVACVLAENTPRCSVSHTQLSNDAQRNRIIAVELTGADEEGTVSGLLVLPFGLRLDDGIALAIDEQALFEARFSTCLPSGCLVPLSLEAAMISRMTEGASLSVTASVNDNDRQATFAIPLAGLASALARLNQIRIL